MRSDPAAAPSASRSTRTARSAQRSSRSWRSRTDVGESRPRTDGGVAGAHRRAPRGRRRFRPIATTVGDRRVAAAERPQARTRATSSTAKSRQARRIRPRISTGGPCRAARREWVEMTFAKPSTVSSRPRSTGSTTPAAAACACPASWRLLYKSGGEWEAGDDERRLSAPRATREPRWRSTPVATDGAARQSGSYAADGFSAGAQEWTVRRMAGVIIIGDMKLTMLEFSGRPPAGRHGSIAAGRAMASSSPPGEQRIKNR